jgi:hypothetical protein
MLLLVLLVAVLVFLVNSPWQKLQPVLIALLVNTKRRLDLVRVAVAVLVTLLVVLLLLVLLVWKANTPRRQE